MKRTLKVLGACLCLHRSRMRLPACSSGTHLPFAWAGSRGSSTHSKPCSREPLSSVCAGAAYPARQWHLPVYVSSSSMLAPVAC